MIPNQKQSNHGQPWEDLNRKWDNNDRRSADPISTWPQVIFYAFSFILTVGWTSSSIWSGKCGTPSVNQMLICSVFGLVALLASLWAGFSRLDWSAAARFLISGAAPLLFPFLIVLVLGVG